MKQDYPVMNAQMSSSAMRLAQGETPEEFYRRQAAEIAGQYEVEISRLTALTEGFPQTARLLILRKASDCLAAADTLKLANTRALLLEQDAKVNACIFQLKRMIDDELARPAPKPEYSGPMQEPPAPAEGIPSWAWVIGGLAAVGLVVLLTTKTD